MLGIDRLNQFWPHSFQSERMANISSLSCKNTSSPPIIASIVEMVEEGILLVVLMLIVSIEIPQRLAW